MAPSSGHLLVPMAMRVWRHVSKKASTLIRSKLSSLQAGKSELQPLYVRNTSRQPIHPAAYRRQSHRRWFATQSSINASLRQFTSSAQPGVKHQRASFPKSTIGAAVGRLTTRAPFASTLRPNLTGGALPRAAGGYSLGGGGRGVGGGARHFSHTPAAPAEVVRHVSAAVRGFWLAGQRAQFDGIDPRTGEKRFKTVTVLQDQAGRRMRSTPRASPGSYVDFHLGPTITALGVLGMRADESTGALAAQTLNHEGFLTGLAVDFARAVKDLGAVLHDLQRLAVLGDLPLSMPERSLIRVQFPGCDLKTVECLCDEVGVRRGVVRQDEDFDEACAYTTDLALLFPFAPSVADLGSDSDSGSDSVGSVTERKVRPDEIDWQHMMSSGQTRASICFSRCSATGHGLEVTNQRLSTPSGYGSMHSGSQYDDAVAAADMFFEPPPPPPRETRTQSAPDYEGLEGIYRFLELCDNSRR
ncbi:MAG: hypothetical protein M1816_002582 [Peltula sp. TS41687]|nr:MAG: hypothetical protein M1816_002582 [Peltula sp. TS41687]